MNDKNIETWLRIFESLCTLHSSPNGQGATKIEDMTNELYERLMAKHKNEYQYGSGAITITQTAEGNGATNENK